jgi:CRP-like cAMP-binding protein
MKKVLFFLGQLNDMDVEWMIKNGHKIEVEPQTKLIKKGEPVENLYIILSGQLSVFADDSTSDSIATLNAGEIVGEMSFVESRSPSLSVVATKPSSVFAIPREIISSRLSENPDFKANFYYAIALFLSSRLRKTTDQLGYGKPEEEDLIDSNILDGVAQAGSRFGQILHRFSEV